MNELFSEVSLFSLVLTVAAFQVGLWGQKKTNSPICNPILVGAVLVVGVLLITGIDPQTYQAGTSLFSWLLTPATVCLAIPMYEQLEILRKNLKVLLAGVAAGAVSCVGFVLLLALVFRFDRALTMSLLPKFLTAAIGVPLSQLSGGIPSVTTVAIMLTGITGAVLGPTLCKLFRFEDELTRGVAFGTAGHVIATARASELSPLTGAVSSLSLVVAGLLAALIFPLVVT
jgi:putative effector of murein hydrolase